MEEIYNELIKYIDKERVFQNELMSKHTTFKIGGPADIFVKINTLEELKYTIKMCKSKDIPITIVGNGSNVLVKDNGIRGVTIKLNFNEIEIIDDITLKVGAGVLLSKVANVAYDKGLSGLEFACGIPGTIGGAIRMNAGAHRCEMKDIVYLATYLDENCNIKQLNNKENEFGYRTSIYFKNKNYILISSEIKLKKGDKTDINKKMEEYKNIRRENQPLDLPSAGSVFKRGENYIAAKLIDECGLKGLNVADAMVSQKHAGFIVNTGNATAEDVLKLIEIVKQKVYKKFNIELELEIEVFGE